MKRNECSCVVSLVCQSAVFIHHFAAMQIYLHMFSDQYIDHLLSFARFFSLHVLSILM